MAIGTLFGTNTESVGLYGTPIGGSVPSNVYQTYFEWFIFKESAGTPATPTGGSWNFSSNTGTPPTGWTANIATVPLNTVWLSTGFVDSRNPTVITWSAPGLLSSTSVYATAYADVFTGNGTTVNWTLSTDPVTVLNMDVSINGVTQVPTTDFTIVGTAFTTTTAAPLGAVILVRYRQTLPLSFFGIALNVGFTPVGTISSTNVQAAIAEMLSDYAASSGSSLVGYLPAGTGAVATTVQTKLRESVSAADYGVSASNTAGQNDAAFIVAIAAATALKKILHLDAGTYQTSATINLTGTNWLTGDGKDSSIIQYSGAGSAIKCANWGGKIQGISVLCTNNAANGIEVGTASRNCSIEDVYLQMTSGTPLSSTGAGIYLNAGTGFSGGITISTSYALQFKYGVKMVGTNLSTGTWTTVSMYNLWLGFTNTGTLTGSAGIYMDALTNGIGTCMYGGTIEAFDTGIKVLDGSYGGVFETDMEGNTTPYSVGNEFKGRIVSAFGQPVRTRTSNTPTQVWSNTEFIGGSGPINENYYPAKYVVTDISGNPEVANTTYLNPSLIEGNPVAVYGLKFNVGIGQGPDNGIEVHPSNHFLQLVDRTIHWDAISPSAQSGSQIVPWKKGSVCYNSNPSVGQPVGWMCTVSGTATGTLAGVVITGTAGQFSCTATNLIVGQTIVISGTLGGTGTITGYSNPTTYYVKETNGATTFTLSASPTFGGVAIVTTAGTPTGLTYTTAISTWVAMANL